MQMEAVGSGSQHTLPESHNRLWWWYTHNCTGICSWNSIFVLIIEV